MGTDSTAQGPGSQESKAGEPFRPCSSHAKPPGPPRSDNDVLSQATKLRGWWPVAGQFWGLAPSQAHDPRVQAPPPAPREEAARPSASSVQAVPRRQGRGGVTGGRSGRPAPGVCPGTRATTLRAGRGRGQSARTGAPAEGHPARNPERDSNQDPEQDPERNWARGPWHRPGRRGRCCCSCCWLAPRGPASTSARARAATGPCAGTSCPIWDAGRRRHGELLACCCLLGTLPPPWSARNLGALPPLTFEGQI